MLMTKRKPVTVGKLLVEEFMRPLGLTQAALAESNGVQRKHVSELSNDRRNVTGDCRDGPYPGTCIRQQSRLLVECAAAQRSLGSHALPRSTRQNRTRPAIASRGVIRIPDDYGVNG